MSKWLSSKDWMYEVSGDGTECVLRLYIGEDVDIVIPEVCSGFCVTSFGNNFSSVFANVNVRSIVFPNTVKHILGCTFMFCKFLEKISLPNGLIFIGDNAFFGCISLTHIDLPSSIRFLGDRAFCCCESLVSVVIPDSVETINSYLFLNCKKLHQVFLHKGLKSIGHGAFVSTNITKVELPESIISLECDSFENEVLINYS